MGQNSSSLHEEELYDDNEESFGKKYVQHRTTGKPNHEFFYFSGNLESVGDIGSILQTLNPVCDDSPGNDCLSISGSEQISDYPEEGEVTFDGNKKNAVESIVKIRSRRLLQRISEECTEKGELKESRVSVTTMVEVLQYCSPSSCRALSAVNAYFHSLVAASRTSAQIECCAGWVGSINQSPLLREIKLYYESSDEDMKRFCRIVENDGFPSLCSVSMTRMSDRNIQTLLKSMDRWTGQFHKLHFIDAHDAIHLSLQCDVLSPRVCYSFAEALSNTLGLYLGSLQIRTGDTEGLQRFFKTVDLYQCTSLAEIDLDDCILQSRGSEFLVHSLWASDILPSNLPPIRAIHLRNTGFRDNAFCSFCQAIDQGALSSLETLDISCNTLSARSLSLFVMALSRYCCPGLRSLSIGSNYITSPVFQVLCAALAQGVCPLLSEVDASNAELTGDDLCSFSGYVLSPFSDNLTRIDLSRNPLITAGIQPFFEALSRSHCAKIVTLLLEGVSFSYPEMVSLTRWLLSGKVPQFRNLVLKNNLVNAQAFYLLMRTWIHPSCPHLKVVDFSGNMIGGFEDETWRELLNCDGVPLCLEQVDYSFNPLTDHDMECLLRFLRRFSNIEATKRITFSDNDISFLTLEHYFESFPASPCALEYLAMDSCNLAGIGPCICSFLSRSAVSNLQSLCLRDCGLTKEDLVKICDGLDAKKCVSLGCIRLDGNAEVDDDFMSRLIETLERGSIPAVYDIECTYTSITEVGVECLLAFLSDNPYSQLSLVDCSCVNLSRSVRDEYKERIKRDFGDLIHVFLFCVCSKHGRYRGSECEATDRLSAVFFSHGFFTS